MQHLEERNLNIVDAYISGKKIRDLAQEHGVSKERIRQVLLNYEKVCGIKVRKGRKKLYTCEKCSGEFYATGMNATRTRCNACIKDIGTYWSRKHKLYCCKGCNSTERRHRLFGYCERCSYHHLEHRKVSCKAQNKKWSAKNKDAVDKIQKKASKKYYKNNRDVLLFYQSFYNYGKQKGYFDEQ